MQLIIITYLLFIHFSQFTFCAFIMLKKPLKMKQEKREKKKTLYLEIFVLTVRFPQLKSRLLCFSSKYEERTQNIFNKTVMQFFLTKSVELFTML